MIRLVAILTCLALVGCGTASSRENAVDLGAPITLAPGETASVNGAGMKLRFVAVTEDSRCPRDLNCIWAGQVRAQFVIQQSRATLLVEILEGESTVASGGYRVTLVQVEP